MKQTIEIEVPEGKRAVYKDGTIVFEDIHTIDILTDIPSVIHYLKYKGIGKDIIDSLAYLNESSFEYSVTLMRAIICACTNAKKVSLTTRKIWIPVVQFCKPGKEENCYGKEILGYIESEGKRFVVVGGAATSCSSAGLGCFHLNTAVSAANAYRSFLGVESKEVAKHISKYFGRTVFELMFRGGNCDWKWVD